MLYAPISKIFFILWDKVYAVTLGFCRFLLLTVEFKIKKLACLYSRFH